MAARGLPLAIAAAGLGLAGCASPNQAIVSLTSVQLVPPEKAFASLGAGGPPVISVTEKPYANATQQEINLGTSGRTEGQNYLKVQIFGPVANSVPSDLTLKDVPLTQVDLVDEAQTAVPGADMRMSLTYVQNRYGAFGYATGRSRAGDLCLYAWQRLQTPEAKVALWRRRATISIRLRMCEPGVTEAELLAPMMNLGIDATILDPNWNPYNAPLPPPEGLDRPGAPMGPPAVLAAAVGGPLVAVAPARQVRRRIVRLRIELRAAAPSVAAEPALPAEPVPSFAADVTVPPPPETAVLAAPAVPPPPPASSAPNGSRS